MKCPECVDGYHWSYARFNPKKIPCAICHGTMEIPADIDYRPEEGKALRKARGGKRLMIKEMAKIMGIKPVELSLRERGFFKKQ